MRLDKQALKARLVEQYAQQVDQMLETLAEGQTLQLTEIEEIALKLRQEVGVSLTTELTGSVNQESFVDVACGQCQQWMRYKGRKPKWLKTRTGTVQIERQYYYCESCRQGHFPPG